MRNSKVGKFVLMATLLVAPLLLLQSCSWTGSDHVRWEFTTLDAHAGDRFEWQGGDRQIELVASSADAGVVVTKIEPADWWGLRQGDVFLRAADKPVQTVRELLGDPAGAARRRRDGRGEALRHQNEGEFPWLRLAPRAAASYRA
jgi:hypothetical protein